MKIRRPRFAAQLKPGYSWAWIGRFGLFASSLLALPGCLSFCHPIPTPPPELAQPCRAQPSCSRDHVYVFLVHGMDPLDYANLEGVQHYLNELGFNKTYYGQLYHGGTFQKEVRRIHREDREARFVLVGFSFGANVVRSLTRAVKDEGVTVELLVYLGGNTLENCPRDRPENAVRIINILASGCIWNGDTLDGAENTHLPDVWHFGSPSHRHTLERLAQVLAEIASGVPIVETTNSATPAGQDAEPTPRVLTPRTASAPHDQWDFLKPVVRLGIPTSERQATEEIRSVSAQQKPNAND